jgi:hypothetical protein
MHHLRPRHEEISPIGASRLSPLAGPGTLTRFLLVAVALLLFVSVSHAADIYVAQNAVGANNGADCADAHSVAWFNTPSSWGTSTGRIGPGTTVHLCGTITYAKGTVGLTVHGSGTSTNPVTIQFEPNAILQSPAGAGISINGFNYITVDGGSNGVIQNTANGTDLTYHLSKTGIGMSRVTGITVKNVTIRDIYMNDPGSCTSSSGGGCDFAGQYSSDVAVAGPASYVTITNNHLSQARTGVSLNFTSGNQSASNITVSYNTIRDAAWQISAGFDGNTSSNILFHDNDIGGNWNNWQSSLARGNYYHGDGIITYTTQGSPAYSPYIYNNYFHVDSGAGPNTALLSCGTAGVYAQGATTCYIFNNVFYMAGVNQDAWPGPTLATYLYNNTFVGPATGVGAVVLQPKNNPPPYISATFENNIFENVGIAYDDEWSLVPDVALSDYNTFGGSSGDPSRFDSNLSTGAGPKWTFLQWQSNSSQDSHSTTHDALVSQRTNFQLQAGSSAIHAGANLTSLCVGNLAPLCKDKAGNPRPVRGPWDAGAYNSPLLTPMGVAVVVQ